MREVLARRHDDLVVVLENVHDAHNASAVLRSCDAFGVGSVALCYTQEEFPKISSGAAANVQRWLQIERYGSVEECVASLRHRSLPIYATELGGEPHATIWMSIGPSPPRSCWATSVAAAPKRCWQRPMRGS